jgi:hypothetical protein
LADQRGSLQKGLKPFYSRRGNFRGFVLRAQSVDRKQAHEESEGEHFTSVAGYWHQFAF